MLTVTEIICFFVKECSAIYRHVDMVFIRYFFSESTHGPAPHGRKKVTGDQVS